MAAVLANPGAPIAMNGQWVQSADTEYEAQNCPGGVEACPSNGTECGLGYEGVLCGALALQNP